VRRSACACVALGSLWFAASAAPARAQDVVGSPAAKAVPVATLADAGIAAALAPLALDAPQFYVPAPAQKARRPESLVPLYVSFATLQLMDVHSTTRALGRGAAEANPLMKGLAGNPLALAAVKVAGSAAVIYAAEKMWKKHRRRSVIFIVAANAAMALVVQHNYRAVR